MSSPNDASVLDLLGQGANDVGYQLGAGARQGLIEPVQLDASAAVPLLIVAALACLVLLL